jgi:hypothetical protein
MKARKVTEELNSAWTRKKKGDGGIRKVTEELNSRKVTERKKGDGGIKFGVDSNRDAK